MTGYVEVIWRVEDGYAGPDAPQRTRISMAAFDADESAADIARAIQDAVQEDFESKISLNLRDEDVNAAVAKIQAHFSQRARGEQ